MTVELKGRIDSDNSNQVEDQLKEALANADAQKEPVILDLKELKYISSAGLRVILHVNQTFKNVQIINPIPEIYEVLDVTGFTTMMKVEKPC